MNETELEVHMGTKKKYASNGLMQSSKKAGYISGNQQKRNKDKVGHCAQSHVCDKERNQCLSENKKQKIKKKK
jgi:hypothetical protein